jgi:tartrate dehydratase beta subunit/fumarate hydratase class I family protein
LDVQVFEALKRKQAIYFQATAGAAAMAMKDILLQLNHSMP